MTLSVDSLIQEALEYPYFQSTEGAPAAIPFFLNQGVGNTLVAVGPNSGGKSFFRKILQCVCHDHKLECIHISMAGRTEAGNSMRLFVYGSESEGGSTGNNSVKTVLTGIKTCKSRETPHVIIWDEPDIGLSEGFSASVGKALKDVANNPLTVAQVVISHSKPLLKELVSLEPHYLHLGEENPPTTLIEWLAKDPEVLPLEVLAERSSARRSKIQKVINAKLLTKKS